MTVPGLLTPREHGTYAQLLFPILSGLILGRPGVSSFALALAVVCVYLAYEPVAVLTGMRGARLQREQDGAARRQLAGFAAAGILLGAAALAAAPGSVRVLAAVPAGIATLLLPLLVTRRVKSIAGETLVAAALAGVHLPVAAAGGAAGLVLWGPPLVWFAGFFLATLSVHAIKARHKRRQPHVIAAALAAPVVGLVAAAFLATTVPALRMLAGVLAVPLLAALGVNIARVHPRDLKRVGWTLVAANTATLVLLTFL